MCPRPVAGCCSGVAQNSHSSWLQLTQPEYSAAVIQRCWEYQHFGYCGCHQGVCVQHDRAHRHRSGSPRRATEAWEDETWCSTEEAIQGMHLSAFFNMWTNWSWVSQTIDLSRLEFMFLPKRIHTHRSPHMQEDSVNAVRESATRAKPRPHDLFVPLVDNSNTPFWPDFSHLEGIATDLGPDSQPLPAQTPEAADFNTAYLGQCKVARHAAQLSSDSSKSATATYAPHATYYSCSVSISCESQLPVACNNRAPVLVLCGTVPCSLAKSRGPGDTVPMPLVKSGRSKCKCHG